MRLLGYGAPVGDVGNGNVGNVGLGGTELVGKWKLLEVVWNGVWNSMH